MTIQNAIDYLKNTAIHRARYGEITEPYEIAIEAIEKRILKKQVNDGVFGKCPCCGKEFNSELISEYDMKCCLWCGQTIDCGD